MVNDLFRESFVGQLIYALSRHKFFQYEEDKPGFVIPERYQPQQKTNPVRQSSQESSSSAQPRRSEARTLVDGAHDTEKGPKPSSGSDAAMKEKTRDEDEQKWRNTVDWYGPDDPENPMNVSSILYILRSICVLMLELQWSIAKKCFVTFDICLITFSIYIGSWVLCHPCFDYKLTISQCHLLTRHSTRC
jgi:DHA1 family multidrug resistance protein-like MFS transporter